MIFFIFIIFLLLNGPNIIIIFYYNITQLTVMLSLSPAVEKQYNYKQIIFYHHKISKCKPISLLFAR